MSTRHRWHTEGAEEVAEHVLRLPTTVSVEGLHAVNIYVLTSGVRREDPTVLVDAGDAAATSPAGLHTALQAVGRSLDAVERVLVTHVHPDHYSLAPGIRARNGAVVHLGAGERLNLVEMNRLRRGERVPHVEADLERTGAVELRDRLDPRRLTGRTGEEIGDPDIWTADHDVVPVGGHRLRALATPGHTRGHVVYHDADRSLWFTGDHVLPHITPSIGYQSAPVRSALGDYMASLQRVLAEPDGVLLPAHGPVGTSMHARARELFEHHEDRLTDTRDAVADPGSTAYQVASRLRWTRHELDFADLDPWHAVMATTETAAHLDVLVDRAELVRTEVPGRPDCYRAP